MQPRTKTVGAFYGRSLAVSLPCCTVRTHIDKKTCSTLASCTPAGLQQASLLGWKNLGVLL
jgi:hypothetical protein